MALAEGEALYRAQILRRTHRRDRLQGRHALNTTTVRLLTAAQLHGARRDKSFMVTGSCGTMRAELVRQLAEVQPGQVV